MFENKTYEALLASALSRVTSPVDKREGSMVMNGVAPSMAEVAQLYIAADFVFQASYILTAPREFLIKRASEHYIFPYPASSAEFRAVFNIEVEAGTRFSCEDLNFVVSGRMEHETDTEERLSHTVVCETAGAVANSYSGDLIPIEYIPGLTYAELVELLIPGEDEEETETFRKRVLEALRYQAFGGNQADYREKVLAIPGVGAVKIHPVWNGDIEPSSFIPNEEVMEWYEGIVSTLNTPVTEWLSAIFTAASQRKLTVGGTVKLTILAADNAAPSETLIDEIQTNIDPVRNAGEGLGLAPIGHVVYVVGVNEEPVNISLNLMYASGWSWEAIKSYIEKVIDDYFDELISNWADSDHLTVRISQIESRILTECSTMITDIWGTRINGIEANLVLNADSIPIRGEVGG